MRRGDREWAQSVSATQALLFIDELRSAVRQLHRWMKPGGVALLSVPGISQISREDMEKTGDYLRFTGAAGRRMFSEEFGERAAEIEVLGNAGEQVFPGALVLGYHRAADDAWDPVRGGLPLAARRWARSSSNRVRGPARISYLPLRAFQWMR